MGMGLLLLVVVGVAGGCGCRWWVWLLLVWPTGMAVGPLGLLGRFACQRLLLVLSHGCQGGACARALPTQCSGMTRGAPARAPQVGTAAELRNQEQLVRSIGQAVMAEAGVTVDYKVRAAGCSGWVLLAGWVLCRAWLQGGGWPLLWAWLQRWL